MKFKTLLTALMITVIAVPQVSLADTAPKNLNTAVAVVKATTSTTGPTSVTGTGTSTIVSTGPADTVAISAVTVPFDQNITFKTFVKDLKLKNNTPKETLAKGEKLFNLYKSHLKAHKEAQAMKAFDQMMDLLVPYADVEMFKAVECVPASPVKVAQ